ncbi:MAG: glutathione peroxidase, partial [Bdellovibrionales bacterium]|nr:glutathione peroxidase [Bdellovibrionales bacterium]
IATKCGYTKQLEGLEALYKKYKSKGLVVVGVPSNDFGGQTPENEGEVKSFCKLNYGVTFPLTEKVVVKGEKKHPLFKDLIAQSEGAKEVSWNFEKFLLNRDGKVMARYLSKVTPESKELQKAIESLL